MGEQTHLFGHRRRLVAAAFALALGLLLALSVWRLAPAAHAAPTGPHASAKKRPPTHSRATKKARKRHHHRRPSVTIARKVQPPPPPPPPAPSTSPHPIVFGIYPGGAAGTVGPAGPPLPEDPVKRLAALQQLKPTGAPFVLHLYVSYTGASGYSAAAQAGADIASYTANGFKVEVVLCYRPSDLNAAVDVPGFAGFARTTVDQLGSNPGVVSLQVTNEANIGGAPNASDGYYPGVKDALIQGVIAAKSQRDLDHFGQLKIGFNWAYALDSSQNAFWSYLGQHGGSSFVQSLDWVGLDAYPGTWGPTLATSLSLSQGVRQATVQSLATLRQAYMPLAGIPATVPIHVSESGYPTGAGRTFDMQTTVLQSAVQAVYDYSGTYNVSDYRWFDLRDANSSSTSFEDHYGLMTDTYVAKPAFAVYRSLVASL